MNVVNMNLVSLDDMRLIKRGGSEGSSGGGGGDTPKPDMPVIGDGKTYLYINIAAKGRMDVPLYFSQSVDNGVVIDWGDGSTTQTMSGTEGVIATHTYADVGEYRISLNPVEGCSLNLGDSTNSLGVMGGKDVYINILQAAEIGKGVTSIGDYAFHFCYSLSNVVILDGVISIGNNAFRNCYSLSSIIIPSSVTSIGSYAFYACYSLSSIVIPGNVISIGTHVFYNCYSLSNVVILDGVTNIGSDVFYYCSSLSNVIIPSSVTSIGNNLFRNCSSLSNIIIPNSITSIGTNAFSSCYSLASIVIPSSVTNISSGAFSSCMGMAFFDFSQSTSVPKLGGSSVFNSTSSDCKIVVPDALYDTWKTATNWSYLASKIVKASEFNG